MPPCTLFTMPREIYGYTVLSIETALLRDKAICFGTLHCTTVYKTKTLKSKFCFKFYPKCHLKSTSKLTLC